MEYLVTTKTSSTRRCPLLFTSRLQSLSFVQLTPPKLQILLWQISCDTMTYSDSLGVRALVRDTYHYCCVSFFLFILSFLFFLFFFLSFYFSSFCLSYYSFFAILKRPIKKWLYGFISNFIHILTHKNSNGNFFYPIGKTFKHLLLKIQQCMGN